MFGKTSKLRLIFLVALAIGVIGAFGQAFILHHELVDCYPYKMQSLAACFDVNALAMISRK